MAETKKAAAPKAAAAKAAPKAAAAKAEPKAKAPKAAPKAKAPRAPRAVVAVDRGMRKTRRGYVVSDKMDKTIVVEVVRRVQHPVYRKYIQQRRRYKAHDEENTCHVGDRVLIEECRPLSRDKRWRLRQILERAV